MTSEQDSAERSLVTNRKAYIGMDLGGSNIYSVAFDENFQVLGEDKVDTEADQGYKHVLGRLERQIEVLQNFLKIRGCSLGGIGLGVPGVVDSSKNMIRHAPNLGWVNVDPVADLGFDRSAPVVLINDVNAGLMGELSTLPRIPDSVLAYFCGTGIGGALALNGKLYTGNGGGAGEVGHMIVKRNGKSCRCGRKGCLEAYIGKWALNQKIKKYLDSGKKTVMKDFIKYDLNTFPVKSASIKKSYEAADPYIIKLMEDYCHYLAVGMSQAINLLAPNMIILGGGIMESMGKRLLPLLLDRLEPLCMQDMPEVVLATQGDLAGPRGAAWMARFKDGDR